MFDGNKKLKNYGPPMDGACICIRNRTLKWKFKCLILFLISTSVFAAISVFIRRRFTRLNITRSTQANTPVSTELWSLLLFPVSWFESAEPCFDVSRRHGPWCPVSWLTKNFVLRFFLRIFQCKQNNWIKCILWKYSL